MFVCMIMGGEESPTSTIKKSSKLGQSEKRTETREKGFKKNKKNKKGNRPSQTDRNAL